MLHIHTIRYYIKGTNNKFSSQHKTHKSILEFCKNWKLFSHSLTLSLQLFQDIYVRGIYVVFWAFDNARQNYSILILEINILYSSHSRLKLKCWARCVYMYFVLLLPKKSPIYVWFYIKFNGKRASQIYTHVCAWACLNKSIIVLLLFITNQNIIM